MCVEHVQGDGPRVDGLWKGAFTCVALRMRRPLVVGWWVRPVTSPASCGERDA